MVFERLRIVRPNGPSFVTFLLTKYRGLIQTRAASAIKSRRLQSRIALSTDPHRDVAATDGDKRLAGIRYTLNNLGLSRSEDQMKFHDAFIHSCLPQIYGDSWSEHCVRVMEQEKLNKIFTEVMVMTPRRCGKTISVAMFVAALLLNVPGIKVAVFSTGRRASGSLMEIIGGMIAKVPGGFERIIRRTQEHLYIASTALAEGQTSNSSAARNMCDSEDTARFISLPAAVNKLQVYVLHVLHVNYVHYGQPTLGRD